MLAFERLKFANTKDANIFKGPIKEIELSVIWTALG
jgi:hypothetical protein